MRSRHNTDSVSEFYTEAPHATASEGLAQGPYLAARAGFEPMTLQTKGVESTNVPPRQMCHHAQWATTPYKWRQSNHNTDQRESLSREARPSDGWPSRLLRADNRSSFILCPLRIPGCWWTDNATTKAIPMSCIISWVIKKSRSMLPQIGCPSVCLSVCMSFCLSVWHRNFINKQIGL